MKRYVVCYIGYRYDAFGDDSYDGWNNFHSAFVFTNRESAQNCFDRLSKSRFHKDVFMCEQIS
jgi:hypothetical protein